MDFRNTSRWNVTCFFITLFYITVIHGKENPVKSKMSSKLSTSSSEFVCGTFKGSEKEFFWDYYQYQVNMKNLQKSGTKLASRDIIFDDIVVVEDDGRVSLAGGSDVRVEHPCDFGVV